MILHVHKDKTDELSANKIGNQFVSNSDHRQSIFWEILMMSTQEKWNKKLGKK